MFVRARELRTSWLSIDRDWHTLWRLPIGDCASYYTNSSLFWNHLPVLISIESFTWTTTAYQHPIDFLSYADWSMDRHHVNTKKQSQRCCRWRHRKCHPGSRHRRSPSRHLHGSRGIINHSKKDKDKYFDQPVQHVIDELFLERGQTPMSNGNPERGRMETPLSHNR